MNVSAAPGLDARSYMKSWLDALAKMYICDVRAIPEDKLAMSPGGVARSPSLISAEIIALMNWTTEKLNGGDPVLTRDDIAAASEAMTNHAAIAGGLAAAAADLGQAILGASDETFNEIITGPFGRKLPMYFMTNIAVNHIWYHDGQLNLMQGLSGDPDIHWELD